MSQTDRVKGTLRKVDTSAFASSEDWAEDWIRKNTKVNMDKWKSIGYSCLEYVVDIMDDNFIILRNTLYEVVSIEKFDYLDFSEVEEKDELLHFHVVYYNGGASLEEAIEWGMKGEDE